MLHKIKQHFKNETLVHLVMVTFALASVFNITSYLSTNGHSQPFAIALGVAVGFGLVSISMMLSKTDHSDKLAFYAMLVATVMFATASSVLQTLAYQAHGLPFALSSFMGTFFTFTFEMVLSIAVSLHAASEKRKLLRQFNESYTDRINAKVAENAMLDDIEIDKTYVKRQIEKVVRAKTDEAIRALMPDVDKPGRNFGASAPVPAPNVSDKPFRQDPDITEMSTQTLVDLADLTAKRQDSARQRQLKLLDILATECDGMATEDLNKTLLGKRLGVSSKTIARDIAALEEAEQISINGHIAVHLRSLDSIG